MRLRYFVYEVQTRNIFPLSPKDGARDAPFLQHVLWAPNNGGVSSAVAAKLNGIHSSMTNSKSMSQAVAFVFENDLYYKPKVQNDLVCRITNTGMLFCSLYIYIKMARSKLDIYVWNIYFAGIDGIIYNGIPDWLYLNTPELKSDTLAFSTNGSYLSFLSFNDSQVNEYE